MMQASQRVLPFDRVVLVLQGGGALGAYQAGAVQALDEAEMRLDWVCGISIGAINASLIAGNPPKQRVERLREFWESVTQPQLSVPGFPWLPPPLWSDDVKARMWANRMSAFGTMLYGVPNFFTPRPVPPLGSTADKPEDVSYYDVSRLKATLSRLVDFDLINARRMRFSVGATNVRTGEPVYFENNQREIALHHVIASASLPPGFPPIEVDGEYYWDGGVVSNTPMQWVVANSPLYTGLVFQVDLWDAVGEVPLDIAAANLRATEIHSASRINISLDEFRRLQQIRCALSKILEQVPEDRRNEPEYRLLAGEARVQVATLVQLKYATKKYESASKTFEFSRGAMEEHWQAGYEDTRAALEQPGILDLPSAAEGVRVFGARKA